MATPGDDGPRDLANIQRLLGEVFRRGTPLTERAALASEVRTVVSGNDRLDALEQAEIYREQFWLRHRDVLRDDFPALRHLLGDEAFDELARAYLDACPPDSYTLRDLGRRLAAFARDYGGFPDGLAGPARDMARFELAFVDIFDGRDFEPVGAAQVEAIPPEAWPKATLTLQPHLTVLSLDYPVHRYRSEARKEGLGQDTASKDPAADPAEVEAGPAVQMPEREPGWVALWRGADLRVHYRPVSGPEAALVEALQRDTPLGPACAEVAAGLPPDERQALPARLGGWFRGWATRGWVVDVVTDP